MTTMRRVGPPVLGLVVLLSGACAPLLPNGPVRASAGLAPKFSRFAWVEEGSQLAVIVSTRPTRSRLARPYLPFEVAVVNRGLPSLTITRESLTLGDAKGNLYPLVGAEELRSRYGGSTDVDRRLAELIPLLDIRYDAYGLVPSNYTPGFDDSIARDRVSIPRFAYLVDFFYFPTPEGLKPGDPLEILLSAPELEDRIVVRFTVEK